MSSINRRALLIFQHQVILNIISSFGNKILIPKIYFLPLFLLFFIPLTKIVEAQDNIWQGDYNLTLAMASKSTKILSMPADTNKQNLADLFKTEKPKLLPEHISFGEKLLWGKNGVFRKTGLVAPLSLSERKYELKLRRTMLTTHQIAGFTTLALMYSTAYFGQRVIDGNRRLGDVHQLLASATIVSYTITGLLAVLSPPPLIRRDQESTVTLHKTLAWIHLAGMILTPIIGSMIRHRHSFNMSKAHFHQVAGYVTTAAFTAAVLVIVF